MLEIPLAKIYVNGDNVRGYNVDEDFIDGDFVGGDYVLCSRGLARTLS